ncbi:uncharacterized protein J8A68_000851 [[Candida] subhashii]|uniref:Mid2 domain-containing protein n=1 Tax=[Candida] subhashii TaxID=561895 RepID=A0A8J5V0X1_9ASCO|nr:uncharacterized protein J8A68_000851 [[Candida] subhashii]KAG7665645.1 hypothetical protein J8A68_000851 [[Candida] subhashii]
MRITTLLFVVAISLASPLSQGDTHRTNNQEIIVNNNNRPHYSIVNRFHQVVNKFSPDRQHKKRADGDEEEDDEPQNNNNQQTTPTVVVVTRTSTPATTSTTPQTTSTTPRTTAAPTTNTPAPATTTQQTQPTTTTASAPATTPTTTSQRTTTTPTPQEDNSDDEDSDNDSDNEDEERPTTTTTSSSSTSTTSLRTDLPVSTTSTSETVDDKPVSATSNNNPPPALTDAILDMPTLTNADDQYMTYVIQIPAGPQGKGTDPEDDGSVQNPYVSMSTLPTNTVFIVMGAVIAFLLLAFIAYHLVTAMLSNRRAKKETGVYQFMNHNRVFNSELLSDYSPSSGNGGGGNGGGGAGGGMAGGMVGAFAHGYSTSDSKFTSSDSRSFHSGYGPVGGGGSQYEYSSNQGRAYRDNLLNVGQNNNKQSLFISPTLELSNKRASRYTPTHSQHQYSRSVVGLGMHDNGSYGSLSGMSMTRPGYSTTSVHNQSPLSDRTSGWGGSEEYNNSTELGSMHESQTVIPTSRLYDYRGNSNNYGNNNNGYNARMVSNNNSYGGRRPPSQTLEELLDQSR